MYMADTNHKLQSYESEAQKESEFRDTQMTEHLMNTHACLVDIESRSAIQHEKSSSELQESQAKITDELKQQFAELQQCTEQKAEGLKSMVEEYDKKLGALQENMKDGVVQIIIDLIKKYEQPRLGLDDGTVIELTLSQIPGEAVHDQMDLQASTVAVIECDENSTSLKTDEYAPDWDNGDEEKEKDDQLDVKEKMDDQKKGDGIGQILGQSNEDPKREYSNIDESKLANIEKKKKMSPTPLPRRRRHRSGERHRSEERRVKMCTRRHMERPHRSRSKHGERDRDVWCRESRGARPCLRPGYHHRSRSGR